MDTCGVDAVCHPLAVALQDFLQVNYFFDNTNLPLPSHCCMLFLSSVCRCQKKLLYNHLCAWQHWCCTDVGAGRDAPH